MPPFRFLLSAELTRVMPGDPLWEAPLPTTRTAAGEMVRQGQAESPVDQLPDAEMAVTYGDYFTAIQRALCKDQGTALGEALIGLEAGPVSLEQIERVTIQLLKHGQYYHPSRLEVAAAGAVHHLALNVALTEDGIALLPRETAALDSLADQTGVTGVPRVLAKGGCAFSDGRRGLWFLAPWFDGFHEFHLTRCADGRMSVLVWDAAADPLNLTKAQTEALLEGAARLLAAAVNPHTLAHIFPWHHAAGDFVVRLDQGAPPQVRLITVRDYGALLPPPENGGEDPETTLDHLIYALLLLIVQAALRLRVDRLDGIGDIVLHPVSVVAPICRGLLDGLVRMRTRWQLPAALDGVLQDYVRSLSLAQLRDLNHVVQGGFATGSPERDLLAGHLDGHVRELHHCLQAL
jgi:hypothetical protein